MSLMHTNQPMLFKKKIRIYKESHEIYVILMQVVYIVTSVL